MTEEHEEAFGEPPFFDRACHSHGQAACDRCKDRAVESGALRCRCGAVHPIEGFVPNLAGELADELQSDSAEMYSYLWESFDVERVAGEDDAQKLVTFREKTGWREEELAGKLVLDAGCGPGQLIALLARAGAHAVGCDLVVPSVLRSIERERRFDFVQADLLNVPFVAGAFDFVYSIGVIHHIPDSDRVFEELARATSREGELSAWVYDRGKSRLIGLDDALRSVTTRLPHGVVKALSVLLSPLFPMARRLKGGQATPIRRKDSEHLIYDWLRTPYRRFYDEDELRALMEPLGWRVRYRSPHPLGLTFRASGSAIANGS